MIENRKHFKSLIYSALIVLLSNSAAISDDLSLDEVHLNVAKKFLNQLNIPMLSVNAQADDAFIFIVAHETLSKGRATFIEYGQKPKSISIKKYFDTDNLNKITSIEPPKNLIDESKSLIDEIKKASAYKPLRPEDAKTQSDKNKVPICFHPPFAYAFIREKGNIASYSINTCGNEVFYELRCKIEYGMSCNQLKK